MSLLESFPIDDLEYISSGNDSDVVRGGNLVAKFYRGVGIEAVQTYRDATNLAADHLEKTPLVWGNSIYWY